MNCFYVAPLVLASGNEAVQLKNLLSRARRWCTLPRAASITVAPAASTVTWCFTKHIANTTCLKALPLHKYLLSTQQLSLPTWLPHPIQLSNSRYPLNSGLSGRAAWSHLSKQPHLWANVQ